MNKNPITANSQNYYSIGESCGYCHMVETWKGSDGICGKLHWPSSWACSRKKGHGGPHIGCSPGHHRKKIWKQK